MWLCRRGSDAAEMEAARAGHTMCGQLGGLLRPNQIAVIRGSSGLCAGNPPSLMPPPRARKAKKAGAKPSTVSDLF